MKTQRNKPVPAAAPVAGTTAGPAAVEPGRYAWAIAAIFWFAYFMNHADRLVIFAIFPLIQALGLLAGAPFIYLMAGAIGERIGLGPALALTSLGYVLGGALLAIDCLLWFRRDTTRMQAAYAAGGAR